MHLVFPIFQNARLQIRIEPIVSIRNIIAYNLQRLHWPREPVVCANFVRESFINRQAKSESRKHVRHNWALQCTSHMLPRFHSRLAHGSATVNFPCSTWSHQTSW